MAPKLDHQVRMALLWALWAVAGGVLLATAADYMPDFNVSRAGHMVAFALGGLVFVAVPAGLALRTIGRRSGAIPLRQLALTDSEVASLEPKDKQALADSRRTARVQYFSIIGAFLGLMFTAGSLVFTAGTLRATQEQQVTERFAKSVEQLSSERINQRLGGLYSLNRLYRDSSGDRLVIREVLAAFVRTHPQADSPVSGSRPPDDVLAALSILAAQYAEMPDSDRYLGFDHGCHFRADLTGLNLAGADLSGLDLTGLQLVKANLRNTNLSGAAIRDSNLDEANLTGANLSGAEIDEFTHLTGATLTGIQGMQMDALPKDTEYETRRACTSEVFN
ncbi:pentapeptide repeat-containing protein [Nonomuraea sp. NPDC055795]